MQKVKIYEIKSGSAENSTKLFSPDGRYFYWNNAKFLDNGIGDVVFIVNKLNGWALYAKIDLKDITVQQDRKAGKATFTDAGTTYTVTDKEGVYNLFLRFDIMERRTLPESWTWSKPLRQSETYYLMKYDLQGASERIAKVDDLEKVFPAGEAYKQLELCRVFLSAGTGRTPEKPTVKEKEILPKEMITHVHAYMAAQGFQYKTEEIANFYLALKTKPFVILAGISGTGKTQLPRKFASAIGMSDAQLIQLPVRPDWTDGSELLGYTAMDGKFIPKELTLAIKAAKQDPGKPYFFILDEMNLARVEHYFSDFLSVIETREWTGNKKIKTDRIIREEALQHAKNATEFTDLQWPMNLYLVGTVNMDETTHPFSRKVLDRANTIEMNDVNLDWINAGSRAVEKLKGVGNTLFETEYLNAADLSTQEKDALKKDLELLISINKILEAAGLHFAYRVRDEIAFYLLLNKKYGLMEHDVAMDFQLVQKILPRIHGSSERVQIVLVKLLKLLEDKKSISSTEFEYELEKNKLNEKEFKYKRTSSKIVFMLKRFEDDRFTSFWL